MEKSIKVFSSFEEQELAEIEYWKNMSGRKKLQILEAIRAKYWAFNNEFPPRLQRVYRVIKRTEG